MFLTILFQSLLCWNTSENSLLQVVVPYLEKMFQSLLCWNTSENPRLSPRWNSQQSVSILVVLEYL